MNHHGGELLQPCWSKRLERDTGLRQTASCRSAGADDLPRGLRGLRPAAFSTAIGIVPSRRHRRVRRQAAGAHPFRTVRGDNRQPSHGVAPVTLLRDSAFR